MSVGVIEHNAKTGGSLGHVHLYLADWGYNTPSQRAHCIQHHSDAITLIAEADLQALIDRVLSST